MNFAIRTQLSPVSTIMTDFEVITEPQIAEFVKSTGTITEYYPNTSNHLPNQEDYEAIC